MENEKTFIVGDIHGCLDMLKRLIELLDWRPEKDRLIFLGDYIDRGENPKGVVDYVLELTKLSSQVQCLIGNHELIFLDYLSGKDARLFLLNGGTETLESYQTKKNPSGSLLVPPEHMSFYENLESFVELEEYYVVHAGFMPKVAIEKQTVEDMTWIRDKFIFSKHDFGKQVIFGHTPFVDPVIMDNKIGLDTGAVYGNKLTCLELPNLKFHSVEA